MSPNWDNTSAVSWCPAAMFTLSELICVTGIVLQNALIKLFVCSPPGKLFSFCVTIKLGREKARWNYLISLHTLHTNLTILNEYSIQNFVVIPWWYAGYHVYNVDIAGSQVGGCGANVYPAKTLMLWENASSIHQLRKVFSYIPTTGFWNLSYSPETLKIARNIICATGA